MSAVSAQRVVLRTHVRLEEVLSIHEISDVEGDLYPCLDSLDLLAVLGFVTSEDDLSGSDLGGERSLGRSSSGNVGDLSSDWVPCGE
jgi:hypothetical protein